jgi:DNA-binding transcriptional LysR family regulator
MMQFAVAAEALDGRDLLAFLHRYERRAREDTPPIDDHRTCAALTPVTAFLGTGQMKLLPQRVQQGCARFDVDCVLLPTDRHRSGHSCRQARVWLGGSSIPHPGEGYSSRNACISSRVPLRKPARRICFILGRNGYGRMSRAYRLALKKRVDRLAAMQAFVRVVETGSFSLAARQLHLGQPAVSKMVAQLEERLGVQLLLRSTQGLFPTPAGHNFYDRAKRIVEETEEAETTTRNANASLSGELRISAAVTFARLHVIPRLAPFLARHTALELEVMLDDRNIDLIGAGVDVALRMGPLKDSSLIARRIAECPQLVIGTPAYFENYGEPSAPADLHQHEAVVYRVCGGGASWTFRKGSVDAAVNLSGRLRVTAAEGVREAVFSNLGFAIASEWMFQPELNAGIVRAVLRDWTLPPMDLWAVFPTGRRASAKARAFVTFMEEVLNASRTGSQ